MTPDDAIKKIAKTSTEELKAKKEEYNMGIKILTMRICDYAETIGLINSELDRRSIYKYDLLANLSDSNDTYETIAELQKNKQSERELIDEFKKKYNKEPIE